MESRTMKLLVIFVCVIKLSSEVNGKPQYGGYGLIDPPHQRNSRSQHDELAEISEVASAILHSHTPIEADYQTESQNLFPFFSFNRNSPIGTTRPFVFHQERAFSQRPYAKQNLDFDNGPYKQEDFGASKSIQSRASGSILGSGNFGVIKGGTYYPSGGGVDDGSEFAGSSQFELNQYNNNGHQRPNYYNPKPSLDPFANFRDFADINTPSSPAFSQFVVVYANKNGTIPRKITEPKNIIETLTLLDGEESKKKKVLSKSKMKLAMLAPEKKKKIKRTELDRIKARDLFVESEESKGFTDPMEPQEPLESQETQETQEPQDPLLALS